MLKREKENKDSLYLDLEVKQNQLLWPTNRPTKRSVESRVHDYKSLVTIGKIDPFEDKNEILKKSFERKCLLKNKQKRNNNE